MGQYIPRAGLRSWRFFVSLLRAVSHRTCQSLGDIGVFNWRLRILRILASTIDVIIEYRQWVKVSSFTRFLIDRAIPAETITPAIARFYPNDDADSVIGIDISTSAKQLFRSCRLQPAEIRKAPTKRSPLGDDAADSPRSASRATNLDRFSRQPERK